MARNRYPTLVPALLAAVFSCAAGAQNAGPAVKPLRGDTPVLESSPSDVYRMERRDRAIPRDFKHRPPIIPHNVKGYQITKNVNMCMVCHAKNRTAQTGAKEPSDAHYQDREGKELPNISARRYFCLQCHVPQFDAEPLVTNTYQRNGQ